MAHRKYLHLKMGIDINDVMFMHPNLLVMLGWVLNFCTVNQLDCVISSIHREPSKQSKSTTHQDFRAFDVSIKNWNKEKIELFKTQGYDELSHLGAISGKTGKPNPVYVHASYDKNGNKVFDSKGNIIYHAHIQCRRDVKEYNNGWNKRIKRISKVCAGTWGSCREKFRRWKD